MPQTFNNTTITGAGLSLLTRAQAGEAMIEFTRIAIGDGQYPTGDGGLTQLWMATELKSPRNSYKLSSVSVHSGDSVKITALVTNYDPVTGEALVMEGYHINEMGLYAKERGKDGTEILYSISVAADGNGDYMPPYNGYPAEISQEYYAVVGRVEEVTIQCDAKAPALAIDLQEHILDMESHVTPEKQKKWNEKQDAITVDSILSITSENPIQNKAVKAALDRKSSTGHTHSAASTTSDGFMSSADKKKLGGIDENANNYTHPSTHPATMISQDDMHRFVTDDEKKEWGALYAQLVAYTDGKISDLIGGAPTTLDTLKEIADAIAANKSTEQALDEAIGKKANKEELYAHMENDTIHVTKTNKEEWGMDIAERAVGFTQATSRANIASGEKVKTILGKIKKWLVDLKPVAFTGSYNDLSNTPSIPEKPSDIGAVSNEYLEEHYAADFVSQKTFMMKGVGWKKIAEIWQGDVSTGSCIIDIKRQYANMNNEYHRMMFVNTYKKYEFYPIADRTNNQLLLKARVVVGASGKCFIEVYYNSALSNPVTVTIENTTNPDNLDVNSWKVIDPVADTETPSAGTVAATYDIRTFFNTGMLAMKDGSNVDGIWGNLTAGAVFGEYTQNGGEQAPGYVASNHVKFNMMRKFKGLTDKAGTYMDCMMMDCYDGNDIPYVTAFGIRKGSGSPRAFIAVGQKGDSSSWTSQAELLTTENIASQTAGKANALSNTSAIGDVGRPVYIGDDGVPKALTNNAGDYYTPAYMYGGKIHGCTNSFVKMEKFFDGSFPSNSYQRVISIYDIGNDRKVSKVSGTSSYVVMLRAVGGSRYGGFMEDFALVFALSDTAAGGVVTSKDVLIGGDNVGRIYFKVAKSDCSTTSVDIQCMVSEGANLTINRIYAVFV